MPINKLIGLSTLMLISFSAWSQESLQDYLGVAARNNPEVKAAFNQYQAALEKVPQVGSLPDPAASFGFYTEPMELMSGDQLGNVQLMQMFPWFGTLKTAKDEASMMALAKYEAFNEAKAGLFYQVKQSWYQLMKYDREITLVRENLELLESLEKLVLVKLQSPAAGVSGRNMSDPVSGSSSAGTVSSPENGMNGMNSTGIFQSSSSAGMQKNMSPQQTGLQDVLRVKMEILDQKSRLALLNDQRQTEQARFNALLNRDTNTPVMVSGSLVKQPLPAGKPALADSILVNNPMLAMLKNEAGSYTSMEEKVKKMGMPMLGLGLNYMLVRKREGNNSTMNGKDMLMPMASVSIPVFRKKYRAMRNEAQFMQEAIRQQMTNTKNNLLVQYRQLIQELDDAERRITLYKEQEDLARKATGLLLSGFTTTGNDYEEVLRMQMKVLDYGFKHIEAVIDYNTSAAMAEKLMNALNF